jgi:L-lactate dehydrogenase complex protein LldG
VSGGGRTVDRDLFLTRVGKAAMTAKLPDSPTVRAGLPTLEPQDLVVLFRERAQKVDAVVHGPISAHGVPKAVVGIASGHQARTFMSWDTLPAAGVVSALASAGMDRVAHHVPAEERTEHQMGYYDLDLGITGATAGFAESGSVVLTHGEGRPSMASLAPRVHVAILDIALIHRTLAHWVEQHPEMVRQTSSLVVITGPSRSADIEQQLNLGVHGPRNVHIVLIR